MDFQQLLRFAVEHDASDVHLQAGMAATLRIGGVLRAAQLPPLTDEELRGFIASIVPARFQDRLDERIVKGVDFSYSVPGKARFRCSAYSHLSTCGMVMRVIKSRIPTIAQLHLPPVLSEIALSHHGLTLVTGTTGSGKSTTLAAMIDLINQTRPCKIVAIEDPVEYMHTPKQAIIAQLEVGTDTPSFDQALRQTLRQDPDVVLVGELRDMDTLRIALRAADTGHQVFSTVHSASAPQTVERIIAMFPPAEQKLLLTQLAGNLEAIISQRLLICRDGTRRPACEVLRGGPVPQKYILDGRALELHEHMRQGSAGQQTFDQDLMALYRKELLTVEEAIRNATNRDQLKMSLRGIGARAADDHNHGPAQHAPPGGAPTSAHRPHGNGGH
jgi:twitching motility protein PilT